MKCRIVPLIQQSDLWLSWLKSGIGGSDAPAIAGANPPWGGNAQLLWARKTGMVPYQSANWQMRRGSTLEPVARKKYEILTGTRVRPACAESVTLPWMRASFDGLGFDETAPVVEIKAPNYKAHGEAVAGRVPDYYLPQVMHLLEVSGAAKLHYVSLSEHRMFEPREQLAIVEVEANPEYQQLLVWLESAFWQAVTQKYWPGLVWPSTITWPEVTQRAWKREE